MENVDIFVLARNLSGFRSQVPTWPLWAVVLMPVQFSKRLLSGSDLSRVVPLGGHLSFLFLSFLFLIH